jgi:hypothetical protein
LIHGGTKGAMDTDPSSFLGGITSSTTDSEFSSTGYSGYSFGDTSRSSGFSSSSSLFSDVFVSSEGISFS